ncbi:MAG: chemotaxis protein CheB [Janthinobacterium lividum]
MAAPYVIVVGAGDGGLPVMRRVLQGLRDDFDGAIVFLLHSGVDEADPLPQLAQGTGRTFVSTAADGEKVSSGRVHVVPRGCHARINALGVLEITAPKRLRTTRPAVNQLFESAAAVFGKRCAGLILSGKGDDGTEGARAIGAAGGILLVQSVADSEHPEMPGSALIGDHPDKCLLIHEIAPALLGVASRMPR